MSYVLGMTLAALVSVACGFVGGCIYTKKQLNK